VGFGDGQIEVAAQKVTTPALVIATATIERKLRTASAVGQLAGCKILFSCKALDFAAVIRQCGESLDGVAVSSYFEAKLARSSVGPHATIQCTAPGFRPVDFKALADLCDSISFNSLEQWRLFRNMMPSHCKIGFRVNPNVSVVSDPRYDPCRPHSKLGVPLEDLRSALATDTHLKGCGLLVHNSFGAQTFEPLLATARKMRDVLGSMIREFAWINLGGGYNLEAPTEPLMEAIRILRTEGSESTIYLEPGSFLVEAAGYIVATVVDHFLRDGIGICVLDTSTCHMPEVFEYQFEPDVVGHVPEGAFEYDLVGASCLAGDIFGSYAFNEPLSVGSKVIFANMGAYTLVKASTFNGINLPSVYELDAAGNVRLLKEFTYEEYANRSGEQLYATV
jgi:carboxynorspermidine decarboxylase